MCTERLSLRKLRIKMNALSAGLPTTLLTRPHFSVILSLYRSVQCSYPSTVSRSWMVQRSGERRRRQLALLTGVCAATNPPPPRHPVHSANNVNKNRANSMQQPHNLLSHRSAAPLPPAQTSPLAPPPPALAVQEDKETVEEFSNQNRQVFYL